MRYAAFLQKEGIKMEKKTMGSFLAALRKANGMTQKDLADRLHVSDKTVSRWERDDGAPELSLIPVIAEIFNITCDELLRGERKAPEKREAYLEKADITPKGEKQRQRILKATLYRYRTRTYIAMSISVAGLISALICNLAFLRGILGFLCGAIAFAACVFMQMICMNAAFNSVEDSGLEEEDLSAFKKSVIGITETAIGVTVGLFGFTFPLLLTSEDAYVGLDAGHTLLLGTIFAGVFSVLYAVVIFFLNGSFVKKGTYRLYGKEVEIYHHNYKLKKSCAVLLVVLLIVTVFVHLAATTIWGPWSIMKGTTFNDYESFVRYMEQDVPAKPRYYDESMINAGIAPAGLPTYYDEYGNEIREEEAMTRSIKDRNGNVVCTYVQRNHNVASFRYTEKDGTVLPITVCTYDDLDEAEHKAAVRHVIFGCLYAAQVAAVLVFYFKKRAK